MTQRQVRALVIFLCLAGNALAGEDSTDRSGPGGTGPAWYQVPKAPSIAFAAGPGAPRFLSAARAACR
jgi:hypothetical protein